jgi:hypothetical protein
MAISAVICCAALFVSFNTYDAVKVFEPTKNYDFLKREWVLSRCVTMEHWETDPVFTFDSVGIIRNKMTYHPVVISQYALTTFDTYMRTKDEKLKTKFLNQIKYLTDPKYYRQINDTVVGYPYTVNFHDLKAPWFSGLAQAEVLGVLVRYYYLTHDNNVLPLMVKIKNMITLPVSKGGLLSTTPEGCVWIEEYPNSAQHKHVLNGFMVTVLLLDDYSKFFPKDVETRKLVDSCFSSVKKTVRYYDTGYGLRYDRGTSAAVVNNWYMKAQVIEIDQLYRITNDEFFEKTSLLWGTYCYNKVIGFKGCIIDSINYSVPATLNASGNLDIALKQQNILNAALLKSITVNRIDTSLAVKQLIDGSEKTSYKIKYEANQPEPSFVELKFINPISPDQLQLLIKTGAATGLTLQYRIEKKDKWKNLKIEKSTTVSNLITCFIHPKNMTDLRIYFNDLKEGAVEVSEIKLNTTVASEKSEYVFYNTPAWKLKSDVEQFTWDEVPPKGYAVFCKTARVQEQLSNIVFTSDSATLNKLPVLESKGSMATFLVVFKRSDITNNLRNFRLESLAK